MSRIKLTQKLFGFIDGEYLKFFFFLCLISSGAESLAEPLASIFESNCSEQLIEQTTNTIIMNLIAALYMYKYISKEIP